MANTLDINQSLGYFSDKNTENKEKIAEILELDKLMLSAFAKKEAAWKVQRGVISHAYLNRIRNEDGVEAVSEKEFKSQLTTISKLVAPILLATVATSGVVSFAAMHPDLAPLATAITDSLTAMIGVSNDALRDSAPYLLATAVLSHLALNRQSIRDLTNKLTEHSQKMLGDARRWMDGWGKKHPKDSKENIKGLFESIVSKIPHSDKISSAGKKFIKIFKSLQSITNAHKEPSQQQALDTQRTEYQDEIDGILSKLPRGVDSDKIALFLKHILETRLMLNMGNLDDETDMDIRELSKHLKRKLKDKLLLLEVPEDLLTGDLLSKDDMQLMDLDTLGELRRKGAFGQTNAEITNDTIDDEVDYADMGRVFNDSNEASAAALNKLHRTIDNFLEYPPQWINPLSMEHINLKMNFKEAMDPDFNPYNDAYSSKFLITKESISALIDHSNTIKNMYSSAIPAGTLDTLTNIILNPEDIKYTTNIIQKINNLGEMVSIDPESIASSFKKSLSHSGWISTGTDADIGLALEHFYLDAFHGHNDFRSKITKKSSDQLFWFLNDNVPNPDTHTAIDSQTFITIQKHLLSITGSTNQHYIKNNLDPDIAIDSILIAPKITDTFSELESDIEKLTKVSTPHLTHNELQDTLKNIRKNQNFLNSSAPDHFKYASIALKEMGKYNPHSFQYLLDTNFDDYYVRNQNTVSNYKNFSSSNKSEPRIPANHIFLSQEDKISTFKHNYIDNEITKESYDFTKSVLSNLVLNDSADIDEAHMSKIKEILDKPPSEDLKQSFTNVVESLQSYVFNKELSDVIDMESLKGVSDIMSKSKISNLVDDATLNKAVQITTAVAVAGIEETGNQIKQVIIDSSINLTKEIFTDSLKEVITNSSHTPENNPDTTNESLELGMNKEFLKQQYQEKENGIFLTPAHC